MKTLIIIDLQNDFLPGGQLEVPGSEPIIAIINKLQHKFDLVIATQDWHPLNHMSFSINHPGRKAFDKIIIHNMEQILWPPHCVQESLGAAFPVELETHRIETIFRKGTNPLIDSYSAFYDNQHLKATGLVGYLREKNIKDLYFCGLAADVCVYYSIQDALKEGFRCHLIEDATYPLDKTKYQTLRGKLKERGVKFLNSWDLDQRPARRPAA